VELACYLACTADAPYLAAPAKQEVETWLISPLDHSIRPPHLCVEEPYPLIRIDTEIVLLPDAQSLTGLPNVSTTLPLLQRLSKQTSGPQTSHKGVLYGVISSNDLRQSCTEWGVKVGSRHYDLHVRGDPYIR